MLRRSKLSSASLASLNKDSHAANGVQIPTLPRSESTAYAGVNAYAAHSPAGTLWSKFVHYSCHYARFNTKVFVFGVGLILWTVLFLVDEIPSPRVGGLRSRSEHCHWGGAVRPGYFTARDAVMPDRHSYHFAAVTDLDKLSAVKDAAKPLFRALLLAGVLRHDEATNRYSVTIESENRRTLLSAHNEGGRGMELSELTVYDDRLLSFDDRSGTVFEILSVPDGTDSYVVPRFVITEGDGDTDKGMKWEWAAVKDNELVLGSMGKEYTRPDGSVANTNNLWVAVVNDRGEIRRENWAENYDFVRHLVGAGPPGYIIMEAILWSDHLKKWVFLPRRISNTEYNEVEDERKGGNRLIMVNEDFSEGEIVEIKIPDDNKLHGFSTFAFVPGTRDRHALSVRSVEEGCAGAPEDCQQRSYLMVFDILTGEVLMDEVKFSDEKFEGIEFVNIYTPPPKWS